MSTETDKRFPPRKWYRRVPFLSTKPIEKRLTARSAHHSAAATPGNTEDGFGTASEEKLPFPESTANWLSILLFHWLAPVLSTGYTRPLQADDLYDMPSDLLVKEHAERLETYWATRLAANNSRVPTKPGLLRWRKPFWLRHTTDATVLTLALNDVCFRRFWTGGVLKMLGDLTQIISPLIIRFLINTLSDPSQQAMRHGFGYVVGLFALLVVSVTTNVHGFYRACTTGILLRASLMHAIYRRATTQLTERSKLKHELGTGKLMSLMSADVTRVDFCCSFLHSAWTSILQIALCFALTVWTMGYSALPGFGLLALLYPLQTFMMRQLLKLRRGSMPFTDARVRAVVEAVSTIHLVKTNAYEKSLLAKIENLRSDEVAYIRKRMLFRALNISVSYTAPTIAAVLSMVCYGATHENGMDAGVIFSTLAFFLLLRTPLMALPVAMSTLADARAAVERLAAFMSASDADPASISQQQCQTGAGSEKVADDVVVQVQDATFAYHDDKALLADDNASDGKLSAQALEADHAPSNRLHIDSLLVKTNQLICIVGPVAAGKSSVLKALLGDMHLVQARSCLVHLGNSAESPSPVAFAPQTAWLLSETVRENIVFGRPFDVKWYEQVLSRCCLHQDMERLPDGDMTVVGEMGVSLSGGQKQRISLARALYGKSPLLLLDDSFSALDAHVGARVFDLAIRQARRNQESTILLVTHSMQFARQADHIVYMEHGQIVEQGSYASLVSQGGPFALFCGDSPSTGSSATASESTPLDSPSGSEPRPPSQDAPIAFPKGETKAAAPSSGTNGTNSGEDAENAGAKKSAVQGRGAEIMQKEERLVGSVSGKTYVRYVLFGNAWLTVPLFVAFIVLYQGTSIVSPLWLGWWQEDKYGSIGRSAYMGGYAAFGLGQSLGLFCMSATFAFFCFWCSNKLHRVAMARLLHAPVSFFETTPQGRITHRFSKDVDAVDNVVGETLRIFISTTVQVIGTVIVVAIVVPAFVAIAAALLLVYTWTGMYYRPSSRELRRLNNLLRSRIYEHFSESLSGLPTLKAFGAVPRFVADNARKIDDENAAYWLSAACQRWLNLRLDLFGTLLVLGAGLLVVGLRGTISASSGGVVLSYVVTAQAVFGNMIRQSAEIENNMNSVERLLHYAYNIEQEPAHDVRAVDRELEARQWPASGRVEFQSVTLSHRTGLDPALREVTLHIQPGDKVGIVGRTGAGKTTLVSALLRMVEPTSGRIVIDGVDIHTVGLHLLRSSLSVISQDAVLLAGTVRYNLDPFRQCSDAWLLQCLHRVGLAGGDGGLPGSGEAVARSQSQDSGNRSAAGVGTVQALQGQEGRQEAVGQQSTANANTHNLTLDSEIKENGANISQGQRSLLSIARALVRQARVVVLDEATASIDGKADAELQLMLNEVTADATVLTVAHRLDTIVATCSKVVVMDSGRVAEFDSLRALYSRPGSLFRALCDAANVTVEAGK